MNVKQNSKLIRAHKYADRSVSSPRPEDQTTQILRQEQIQYLFQFVVYELGAISMGVWEHVRKINGRALLEDI